MESQKNLGTHAGNQPAFSGKLGALAGGVPAFIFRSGRAVGGKLTAIDGASATVMLPDYGSHFRPTADVWIPVKAAGGDDGTCDAGGRGAGARHGGEGFFRLAGFCA